jgi:hypothetical protein
MLLSTSHNVVNLKAADETITKEPQANDGQICTLENGMRAAVCVTAPVSLPIAAAIGIASGAVATPVLACISAYNILKLKEGSEALKEHVVMLKEYNTCSCRLCCTHYCCVSSQICIGWPLSAAIANVITLLPAMYVCGQYTTGSTVNFITGKKTIPVDETCPLRHLIVKTEEQKSTV